MEVEWDPEKDLANHANHGVSFEEAAELFKSDADYLEIFDVDHSDCDASRGAALPTTHG